MSLTIILDFQNPDACRAAKIVARSFTPRHRFISSKLDLDFRGISVAFVGVPYQEVLNRAVRETTGLAVFSLHRPHILPAKVCWS